MQEQVVKRVFSQIVKSDKEIFNYLDNACYEVKNLYNYADYLTRQVFILCNREELSKEERKFIISMNKIIKSYNKFKKENLELAKKKDKDKENLEFKPMSKFNKENRYLHYDFLDFLFKNLEQFEIYNEEYPNPYRQMSVHTAQQTLKGLMRDWKSYFKASSDYYKFPHKYTGRPRLPKYLPKNGRKTATFTNIVCTLKNNQIIFPKTNLTLPFQSTTEEKQRELQDIKLKEVRVVPYGVGYKVEVVYDSKIVKQEPKTPKNIIAIDLGVSNFATITNNIGLKPIVINGRLLKSVNRYYNKEVARYKSYLPEGTYITKRIQNITSYRNNFVDNFMHNASKQVIKYCLENDIDTIVVGKNDNIKQDINIGRTNNQNFVQIPYLSFIKKLSYKAEPYGINVIVNEESYTSKSSFFDNDILPIYNSSTEHKYSFRGRRVSRGLYKTSDNVIINADVNGSYNILKKVFPNAFDTIFNNLLDNIRYFGTPKLVNIIQCIFSRGVDDALGHPV